MAPPPKESFLREYARGLVISLLIGLGIAAIMYFIAPRFFGVGIFGYGALIGLVIASANMLLDRATEPWLRRQEPIVQKLSRAVIYFVGGNGGWFGATWIARELSLVHPAIWTFGKKMFPLPPAPGGGSGPVERPRTPAAAGSAARRRVRVPGGASPSETGCSF